MAQAGTVWVDVRGDTSGLVKDIGTAAQTASRTIGSTLGSGAKTIMSDIGTAAGLTAVGIAAIGGAAVKASTEFNKSMSGVSAVAGATAGELDLLREAALKAGADTAFSASQAATAQAELARAGVSVSDILGGALAGSLGLAAAGQLDLGKAAEISAQALNIFNLEGSETTRVADVLAAGANKSAADVTQLGDALRQGGLVAAQTGLSLEETVGVLSLFADSALVGSDAGTSFKTFLQRLVPQSEEASKAMETLGLNFFDATGAFVGIEEVAGQLQTALGDLSDEQRNAALTTLFGSDAVRAASILMDGGAAAVRDYTAAVDDQGAAARMAAEQLNNLAGDVEQFKGSVETSLIRIGDLFDGVNRSIVQSGTEVVNVFNDFATTPAWAAIQRNFDRLAELGGGRLSELADKLGDILGSLDPADVDRAFSALSGGFAEVTDAAEGLEPVIIGVGAALSSMALGAIPLIGGLVPAISPLTGLLGGLVLGSEEGRDALAELGERAADLASGAGVDLLETLSNLAGELSGALASALSDAGNAAFDAAEVLGPVLADAIDELGPPIADLIEAGGELVANVLPVLAELAGDVLPPAVELMSGAITVAADAVGFLADNLELLAPALGIFVGVKYATQIGAVGAAIRGAGEQALFLKDSIGQIAATQGVSKLEALKGAAGATGREAGGLATTLVSGLNPAVVGVTAAVTVGVLAYQNYAENKKRVAEAADNVAEALRAEASEFERLNDEAARQTLESKGALSTFNLLGDELGDLVDVTATYGDEVSQLDNLFKSQGDDLNDFRTVIADLPEPVREIGEAIADLNESGAIDQGQALRFFQALDELAQGSAESIAVAKAEFSSLAQEAAADGAITADQLTLALDAISNAETPEELNAAFNLLNGFLGGTADEARRAANEILGLIDNLQELTGATRDVDEAERRLKDSFNDVLESFGQFGAGIDSNTEAGRRNADAIQQAVESAEALAEAQAQTDLTGESSRQTLQNLADQLLGLRDAGLLTAEEYQRLLDLYDLTPTDINTTVNAETAEAQAKVNELRQKILGLPGVSEPTRAFLLAQLDQGNLNQVEATIAFLARQREAIIKINPVLPPNSPLQGFPIFNPGGQRRAKGGPVAAGEPYLVGEEGPELIVPSMDGTVIPNDRTRQILAESTGQYADGGLAAAAPRPVLAGPMSNSNPSLDLAGLREDFAKLTAAIATARPIQITEAASARQTAEQVLVRESRLMRMAGV
jgi:TP901 family phage tail tape measure protein